MRYRYDKTKQINACLCVCVCVCVCTDDVVIWLGCCVFIKLIKLNIYLLKILIATSISKCTRVRIYSIHLYFKKNVHAWKIIL